MAGSQTAQYRQQVAGSRHPTWPDHRWNLSCSPAALTAASTGRDRPIFVIRTRNFNAPERSFVNPLRQLGAAIVLGWCLRNRQQSSCGAHKLKIMCDRVTIACSPPCCAGAWNTTSRPIRSPGHVATISANTRGRGAVIASVDTAARIDVIAGTSASRNQCRHFMPFFAIFNTCLIAPITAAG